MLLFGIDVSSVQGQIDWDKVAGATLPATLGGGKVRFALGKCGNGNTEVNGLDADTFFLRNAAGAKRVGIPFGPYHFLYPLPTIQGAAFAGRDPREQARAHWKATGGVGASKGEIPMFRDLEWPYPQDWPHWGCSKNQIADWDAIYKDEYETLSGRVSGLYTDRYFWTSIGGPALNAQAAGPLWTAQPRETMPGDADRPTPWAPFAGWSIWQWTGTGATAKGIAVPGVPSLVDGNVIFDETGLANLLAL